MPWEMLVEEIRSVELQPASHHSDYSLQLPITQTHIQTSQFHKILMQQQLLVCE